MADASLRSSARGAKGGPAGFARNVGAWLSWAAVGFFAVFSSLLVLLVVFASETPFAPYAYIPSLPAIASAVLACFVVAIASVMERKYRHADEKIRLGIVLTVASAALFAVQSVVVVSISYRVSWDPGTMLDFAQAVSAGESVDAYGWYYDLFPNNYLLTVLLVFICEHSGPFDPAIVAGLVGSLLVNLACALTALTARRITGSTAIALITWLAFAVLGCLSPWISVPYSDVYSTAFVAIGFFSLSMMSAKNSLAKNALLGFAFGLSIFVGGLLKPNILVIAIAAGISGVLIAISRCDRAFWHQALSVAVGVVFAAALAYGALQPWSKSQIERVYVPNDEAAISLTHYLMMGANDQYFGYFSFEDYAISRGISSYEERQRVNMDEFFKRLHNFGVVGYLVFEARKAVVIYNDGSFGFGGEGQPLPPDEEHMKDNPLGSLSEALRELCYFESGKPNPLRELEQVIWMAVLFLLPFSVGFGLGSSRKDGGRCFKASSVALVLMVSFMGLSIFLLLFEARSRYLYCCLPMFFLLASMGLSVVSRMSASSFGSCRSSDSPR